MTRWIRFAAIAVALALLLAQCWGGRASLEVPDAPAGSSHESAWPAFLPPEAAETLRLIGNDGPYPYDRDGSVFQNREGLLPQRSRGYYREYTVTTPGSPDRGARRIVTGGEPPEVFYYTDDHYRSFRRLEPDHE